MYSLTTATQKIKSLTKRIRAIQGGTAASKTISVLLYLIAKAQSDKSPTISSVVAESLPHLKKGAMRDFINILETHRYYKEDRWNRTDYTYTFETGSKIEFFSVDQSDKVRGPRRDRLFINEANNVSFETFEQLEVRTKEFIFLDWNPTNEFWFYTDVLNKRNDVEHLTLTYKDNEALSPEIVASIEQRKNRAGWWKVYGLGLLGEVEGKIYTGWQIIDEIPFGARLERYGLDFGYTNDPSVIVALYYYNGGYIVDEILFQKGMSNKQLADTLLNQKKALTIADAAEPKSIDEIRSYGVNIQPANKGQGSVLQGIQAVQNQDISITKRSINVIKEYRNYLWQTDKDGRIINEPEHLFSHCFAPETIIATTKGKYRIDKLVGQEGFLYSKNGFIKRFYNVRPTRLNAEMVSLTFDDGDTLTVTPDHLLLLPNGEWIEAGLLCLEDMIQSATHETNLRWSRVYSILWRKILQGLLAWKERVFAPSDLAELLWRYTYGLSYSPQGRQQGEQFNYQLGTKTQNQAFERTHDTGETSLAEKMDRDNSSPRKQVARVKRGAKVSLVAWQEKLGRTQTIYQKLCSLPQRISNANQSLKRQILWPELQNESPTKKIKGISRGFCPVTYNLEVEDTHCLLANGVIAHNSMDSIRYALNSVAPLIQRQEMIDNMPRYEIKPKPNPAR